MDYSSNRKNDIASVVNEPDYEKASTDLLRAALERSYTERFLMTTRLYKIEKTMRMAKVTHKPYNL